METKGAGSECSPLSDLCERGDEPSDGFHKGREFFDQVGGCQIVIKVVMHRGASLTNETGIFS
jgi:hypothetical protein